MKIFFTPFYANNPYQLKIIKNLSDIGLKIDIAKTGVEAFFKTKGIKEAEVIHFHWFEPYLKSSSFFKSLIKLMVFLIRIFLFKKKKKFVWTVHNLVNHEKKNVVLDKVFLFFFVKMIDVFCVHNEFTKNKIISKFKINRGKIELIPHGNYSDDYIDFDGNIDRFKRDIMEVDTNKLTFTLIGHIRPYKGVLDLIKAFKLKGDSGKSQLLISGRVSTNAELDVINREIEGFSSIIFKPGFIKDSEMQGYLKCSDIMVYPYKNILTSGALILGMSLKKTCIASDVGSMSEFLEEDFMFNSIESLASLLSKLEIMNKESLDNIGELNYKRIEGDTWENMALRLKEVYCNENRNYND